MRVFKVPYRSIFDPDGKQLVKFAGDLPSAAIPSTTGDTALIYPCPCQAGWRWACRRDQASPASLQGAEVTKSVPGRIRAR